MQFARAAVVAFALSALSLAQSPPPAQNPAAAPVAAQEGELRSKAFAAENAGRFGEAADAFLALARLDPQRHEWAVAAARCLGRSGRFKEAIDLLDTARKRFPDAVAVPGMLARTLLLQVEGDSGALHPEVALADAIELAEGVLAVAPDDLDSRLVLAQARYLSGDRAGALQQAEEASRRHPGHAGAQTLIGRIAIDRFRVLLRQYQQDPGEGQVAADRVGAIDAERQRARSAFQKAITIDPARAHPHVALGQLAALDQKLEVARGHFADALTLDPDVAVDHDALLQGMDWQQRAAFYAQLRERYARGTTGKPAKASTLAFHEGRARYDGQDWQGARKCLEQALADNPGAKNADYYLFLCAYRLDDHDAAELHAVRYAGLGAAAFADVVRGVVGDQRAEIGAILQYLANRAWQQKRLPQSRDLNHVTACLRDSADAWNNHAFLCRETGDFEGGWSSYQHALEKEPDSPQLLNDAAVILQYHRTSPENLGKARGMYERAVQLADKALADSRTTGELRARATQAKADALANLAALPK